MPYFFGFKNTPPFCPKIKFFKENKHYSSIGSVFGELPWRSAGGYMSETLEDLKYEYEKAMRVKTSLEKNYERRKKLNLLDEDTEYSLKQEIAEIGSQLSALKGRVRALESQHNRSRVISETNESSPWGE